MHEDFNHYLLCGRRMKRAHLRLICFPHAGGIASVYRPWGTDLGQDVEVLPIQLRGRDGRSGKLPFHCWNTLVGRVANAISALDDKLPFVLFGHSFGGLVAFEVIRELRRRGANQPNGLLISGRPAPSLGAVYPLYHLGDDDLLCELLHMDPMAQASLRTPTVFQELLPRLRTDLKFCDSYVYKHEPPLTVPIVAFAGRSDPVGTLERVEAWRHETLGPFACHVFDGGHFFLKSAWPLFVETLRTELNRLALELRGSNVRFETPDRA